MKEFMMGTLNQSAGVPASLSASTEAPSDPATIAALRSGRAAESDRSLTDWPLRVRVALVAAWEVDALAAMLIKASLAEESGYVEGRAVCSVLNRVRDLAVAVMAAIDDEADTPSEMQKRYFPGQEGDFADVGSAA